MVGIGQLIVDSIRGHLARANRVFGQMQLPTVRYPGLVGSCLVLLALLLGSHVDLGLQDEAHLWYGAQRVLAGEIPLRDFQGYDPGRYYWAAAIMALLGSHGIVAMQASVALFAAIGAWLANRLVFRNRPYPDWWLFLMVAGSFLMWMFPRHKLFDVTSSVVLVALLAWLIEQPTRQRSFIAGIGLGVIAIFGRNHGLYGAVADVMALAYLTMVEKRNTFLPDFSCWASGVLIGYAPMVLAAIFIPGFWTWLWVSIHVYFEMGATNNNLPVPWPWLVPHGTVADMVRFMLVGTLLIVQLLFGFVVTGYSVWRATTRKIALDPLVLASALLAIPYTHHAFARAGLGHLAQAIYPMLIGTFALILAMPRRTALVLATLICATSTFILLPDQPLYKYGTHRANWVATEVGSDTLYLPRGIAQQISVLKLLVEKYAPAGQEFVATPYLPAAYALFDRRAAVWDPYSFFPADAEVQEAEIARIQIEHPAFVLVEEKALDNDLSLAYSHTNPLVYDFIGRHFVRISDPALPSKLRWELYIPTDSAERHTP